MIKWKNYSNHSDFRRELTDQAKNCCFHLGIITKGNSYTSEHLFCHWVLFPDSTQHKIVIYSKKLSLLGLYFFLWQQCPNLHEHIKWPLDAESFYNVGYLQNLNKPPENYHPKFFWVKYGVNPIFFLPLSENRQWLSKPMRSFWMFGVNLLKSRPLQIEAANGSSISLNTIWLP